MKDFLTYRKTRATEEQLQGVMKRLEEQNYEWKRTTATGAIFKIFTDKSRLDLVQEILENFPNTYISSKKPTVVLTEDSNVQFVVKPLKGTKPSAGIENENSFIYGINRICQVTQNPEGINIRFIGSNGVTFECKGIKGAIGVGLDTSNRKKADVILQGDKDYPISLKQRNAQYWESADSYAGRTAKRVINKAIKEGKTNLVPIGDGDILKLTKELSYKANKRQVRQVVFGSDILGKGCIIHETFTRDIRYTVSKSGWIEIKVSKVFKKTSDVENDPTHAVWFLIRNDRTRNSRALGIHGLRILATYASRIKRTVQVSQSS